MSPIHRFRWAARYALVLLASTPGSLVAQDPQALLDGIDTDRLRAAIAAYTELTAWRVARYGDPLARLRRDVSVAIAPPGARYEPQCSFETSAPVFSLGGAKFARGHGDANLKRIEQGGDPFEVMSRALAAADRPFHGDPVMERYDAGARWYKANRYHFSETMSGPAWTRRLPDSTKIVVGYPQLAGGLALDPACRHLSGGPIIAVGWYADHPTPDARDIWNAERLRESRRDEDAPEERRFEAALAELGLTSGQFGEQLGAVVEARGYASLRDLPTVDHPLLPRVARVRALAEWYGEHGAAFEPAIDALWRAYEPRGRASP